ncbi:MAG: 2Fe-2S iron-sulfur cluster binding domain-containing protein [Opitutus sp.]|nr:2Fe-2S iron-sulfur cluster binding domain-containing protein [Opitutus sp.]
MHNTTAGTNGAATTDSFEFTLNGDPVRIEGVPATTTLLDWLRGSARTGSKCGCAEGDCGACTVALAERDASGQATYRAINSCIALLPMFAGREVVTVEGLATGDGPSRKLHPVQAAMVEHYGSQCGYCTPGVVVSMFEAYYRRELKTPCQINDQLCGNLCRCTGYRPIRDAMVAALAQCVAANDDAFAQRLREPVRAPTELSYAGGGERFFRPTSLAELFALKKKFIEAKLVAGATEIGVELNKKFKRFPVLISTEGIAELTSVVATPTEWRIGAAVTLTLIEEALAGEYPSLAKMFVVFAARQIRNRATLGGNLVTASPIGDSAPVLLTLDAAVVLASTLGERTVPLSKFFTGYWQTQLRPDEVMKEIVLPRGRPAAGLTRRVEFVKVSHRVELDISIVAAAFRVDVDAGGVVREARIAYGGVAERTKRALAAEAALIGQKLGDASVVDVLRGEFTPIDDVRSGAAYRRGLIVSLWEKFVSGETSLVHDTPVDFSASAPWAVADATRALRHESAVGHVTGAARYVDDTAQRRPMLEVWPVMAPHARAKILRRDATKARGAPGIAAVLLAEDIPGENNTGPVRHDEPLLASDEVFFHGQVVALVVGESLAACRAAAALVDVDYAELPAVVGIPAALAAGSFHTEPHTLTRGDWTVALAAAPARIDGEISFGGQEHFYLETQAAWAEAGEDGTMVVHASTQHPSEIQAIVAEVLHVPRNKVVVQAPRMGGGFGGKETQGNAWAAFVALASRKTGRPVRVQLDRDLDMALTGKRHPFHAKFSVGHDRDGRLLAADVELVSDGGWSLDLSQPILDRALFHLDNAYYLPAVHFTGRVARTNVTSHTAFRGFGGPQGMLVIEEIMDRVARACGLPPEVVRERNLYHGTGETNRTHYFEDIGDNRIRAIWEQAMRGAKFAERRVEIAAWNRAHPRVKRGLAITPVKFGISFTLTHYNQAGAYVVIYADGSVQVNHGGTEMGQGLYAKMLGVAMRELGVPAELIRIMPTSTDKVPNTSATAASSGADLNGMAVAAACVTLRERLAAVAAGMLGATVENVVMADGWVFVRGTETREGGASSPPKPALTEQRPPGDPRSRLPFAAVCAKAYTERVSLAATGFYKTPDIHWDWAKSAGRPFHYFSCGAAVTEVEVDGYTGMSRVRRVDVVHDVGDSLNPGIDRGQIEGGFVQGMGWLTSEELKWDAKGRLQTHSASTYQIPAISDAPIEFNVTLLKNATQPNAIHGSKAVGEPPLMLALSVREALRDAVANFGAPGGQVALASPATGEAVWAAIQGRR